MAMTSTLNTADMIDPPKQFPEYRDLLKFPEYLEPFIPFPAYYEPSPTIMSELANDTPSNASTESLIRTPGRKPSPQPVHFSVPLHSRNSNGNGHRILRSATVGYIAPEFKGKQAQMEQGMLTPPQTKA